MCMAWGARRKNQEIVVLSKPLRLALGTTQTPVQRVLECEADRWPLFVTELQLPGDVPLFFDMSSWRAEGNLEIYFKEDNLKFWIVFSVVKAWAFWRVLSHLHTCLSPPWCFLTQNFQTNCSQKEIRKLALGNWKCISLHRSYSGTLLLTWGLSRT